jgi:hypothetical protein
MRQASMHISAETVLGGVGVYERIIMYIACYEV